MSRPQTEWEFDSGLFEPEALVSASADWIDITDRMTIRKSKNSIVCFNIDIF